MITLRVENVSRRSLLGSRVAHSVTWWTRLRGLLGVAALQRGEGMLLSPCSSIHMIGMKFPIDLVFLDASGRVLEIHLGLPPGFRSRSCLGARHALELPSGAVQASGTERGDVVRWSTTPAVTDATSPQSAKPAPAVR